MREFGSFEIHLDAQWRYFPVMGWYARSHIDGFSGGI